LREGLLSRSTLHTGNSDAASGGYSGLNSLNLSNCTSLTSSEMASLHLHSGDDGEQAAVRWQLHLQQWDWQVKAMDIGTAAGRLMAVCNCTAQCSNALLLLLQCTKLFLGI
jgi:hypothetical protein